MWARGVCKPPPQLQLRMAGARPQENYKPPKGRKKKKQEEVVAVALDDLPSDFDFSLLAGRKL